MSLRFVRSVRLPAVRVVRRFPANGRCYAPTFSVVSHAGVPKLQPPMTFRAFDKPTGTFLDPEETRQRVFTILSNFEKVDKSKLNDTAHFINDLGLDSLDQVEVVMAFEEEFIVEIPDGEAERIQTVEDAVHFLTAHPRAV